MLYRMAALKLESSRKKPMPESRLETLSCGFIKTGLHRWHFPGNLPTFGDEIVSQKHL